MLNTNLGSQTRYAFSILFYDKICVTHLINGHQQPDALSTDVQNTGLKSFEVLKQRVYMKKFHNIHYPDPPRVQIGNASSSQKNELRFL
jgi:hypothetical protein